MINIFILIILFECFITNVSLVRKSIIVDIELYIISKFVIIIILAI